MAYTGSSVAGGEGNTTFHATSKYDGIGKEIEIFTVDFVDSMAAQTAKAADQNTAEDCIRVYGNIVEQVHYITVAQKKHIFLKVLTCTLELQQVQVDHLHSLKHQVAHQQQLYRRLL